MNIAVFCFKFRTRRVLSSLRLFVSYFLWYLKGEHSKCYIWSGSKLLHAFDIDFSKIYHLGFCLFGCCSSSSCCCCCCSCCFYCWLICYFPWICLWFLICFLFFFNIPYIDFCVSSIFDEVKITTFLIHSYLSQFLFFAVFLFALYIRLHLHHLLVLAL